ncbi:uncharacterized protein ATC70_000112 [Mucor velutinosus]|uniref:Uncharacterized protein n=1 Tax=Mucor velutinosus TaxID=708070 RepID=A0AAN7DAN9_9FUNG|nr:hypothetical protein ATC70_000112 [Mucor velutinosus]
MTPLNLNHTDKAGYLLWGETTNMLTSTSARSWLKVTQSGQMFKYMKKYIDACGEEAEANKTCINWYAYYAQKL